MKIADMERFVGPLYPDAISRQCGVFFLTGLMFTAWFIHYEVTNNRYTRRLKKEIGIALVASTLLGIASLLLLILVGVNV